MMSPWNRIVERAAGIMLVLGLAACSGDGEPADEGDAGAAGDGAMQVAPDSGTDADGGDPDAGTTDTWSTFAADFFAEYCVRCHGDGDRDYSTLDHVRRDAETIRCGVAPERIDGCSGSPGPAQFPIGDGPRPTDDERRRLVDWIDAGLPE